MPNAAASRTCAHAREARMRAFEGTHPTLRQSPPSRCFSTRATRAPRPAAPAAVTRPAVPAPITTRLYRPAGSGLTQSGGCTFWTSARLNSSSGWIMTRMKPFSRSLLKEARRPGTPGGAARGTDGSRVLPVGLERRDSDLVGPAARAAPELHGVVHHVHRADAQFRRVRRDALRQVVLRLPLGAPLLTRAGGEGPHEKPMAHVAVRAHHHDPVGQDERL